MANLNNATKQLIQVNYEAQPLMHVPLIMGNECFVITQQDVRRIEDTRYITYSKLAPNGELIPMENLSVLESKMPDPRILEILNQAKNQQPRAPLFVPENRDEKSNLPEPMETNQLDPCKNSTQLLASVNQQLDWSKKPACSCTMFPFHRTVSSNTDNFLEDQPETPVKTFCNKGTSTTETSSDTKLPNSFIGGARCELKIRKILRFCDEC